MRVAMRSVALMVVVVVVAAAGWVCTAAPIVPGRNRVTNEIRSLAGVERLEVEVKTVSSVLLEMKYPLDRVEERITAILAEHEIETVEDIAAPVLSLVLLTETSSDHADMVSFTYHLSLEQEVVIERLDEKIFVPTYALVHGSLTTREHLVATMENLLPIVIRHFAGRLRTANVAHAG